MPETFSQKRREKRWLVWTKPSTGQIFYRSGTNPDGDPIYTALPGEGWSLISEDDSFENAKRKVVEQAGTLGLDKVKLTRAVDLYTVLYPIS